MIEGLEKGSFRDRDGFVFYRQDAVYRAVNNIYKNTWTQLSTAPFFDTLIQEGKLPAFTEVPVQELLPDSTGVHTVLQVQRIPFISYPHEWSFAQLKKAALLTLELQKKALQQQFTLKDASAYNVQFLGPKPVFIDHFSFEPYTEGGPWAAYGQFCRHFLGPLLLAAHGLQELQSLFVTHTDGIPLSLVSRLLPWRSRFSMLAYTHIHLHAKFEHKHAGDKTVERSRLKMSRARSLAMTEHLEQGIRQLKLPARQTNWTDYYDTCSYNASGLAAKKAFVEQHLAATAGQLCLDLGANTGEFSELAATYFKQVLACDSDAEVVRAIQAKKTANVLALHVNLANPGPAHGWNGEERKSFIERAAAADLVLALALVHHLCIGNNVPLDRLADFFAGFAHRLIIEFVPKSDVQVTKLLVTRRDIFEEYTQAHFVEAFSKYYTFEAEQAVPGSERLLFLLKRKQGV